MASVVSFQKNADGVTFNLNQGLLKVKVCSDNIVQVKYTNQPAFPSKKSLVINNEWKTVPKFSVTEMKGDILISTKDIIVRINRADQSIKYTDIKGKTILAEDGKNGTTMTDATIAGLQLHNCATQFLSPADEALYGLGCHPEDSLSINYKGRNQELLIKYMTGAIPVLLSNKGYGLLWDNYSPSYFYGAEAGNTKYKYLSESGDMVDYFFFYGPDLDRVIASYRLATGSAPMFPKWTFGLFQSQDRYKSQAEVLSVKDKYRNGKIPVDCIVQDWYYWEPNVIGSHVVWPERYPNPKAMVDQLHQANIHAMISIWPVFAKGTPNYNAMEKAGNLTTLTWKNGMTRTQDSYYDAHSPKARQMYWDQARDSLIAAQGWDAWWVDQCEPDNDGRLDERRQCSFSIGKGIDYYNTFSLMHTTGLYDNWRKDIPGKRAYFLVRQAFAGQQRNATTLWSSDINNTWTAYRSQVPQGINACASGIPFWTSDIGGYRQPQNWDAPDWSTPNSREIFTRWFQFGTFSPIFRIHGKGERALFSDNWDANTKAILLKYDHLRYRLMPYIYSLAWKVTHEDYTIMRSLAFDFRNDANINSIPDQYMFGPAFLVSPVTERMYNLGKKPSCIRKVYLPKPATWYDFWTGVTLPGGQTVNAAAPIETIPLYIRAGSILPMGPYLQFATEKPADPLEIRVYAGADGSFVLYEDENDTYNYEKGVYSTISFQWNDAKRQFTVGNRKGSFPGMLQQRTLQIVLVGKNKGTGVDITAKPDKTVLYKGKEITIQL
ncbi:MAG: glycoside hydrolase family 31 protein [Bacteroidales bacterium]|nr:glycoside hydrolase family 31 protein [Bacteroidales bacterium]